MKKKRQNLKKGYNMNLTPRLLKIASLVPQDAVLADVGTDHAYVPVYCILNGICKHSIAMDINEGPLKNAEETVKHYGVSDRVELRLSDGLCKLDSDEADTIVIAGMGGLLIKSILEKANLKCGTTLILQPMLAQKELREYLYANDIAITDEYLAKEDSKIYNILVAKVGNKSEYSLDDILIGRNVSKNSPELLEFYKSREINVRKKILGGLSSAKVKDNLAIQTVTNELERWLGYED